MSSKLRIAGYLICYRFQSCPFTGSTRSGKNLVRPRWCCYIHKTKDMRLVSFRFGLILGLSNLAAHGTDDMLIFSDRFNNGWGDNWSYMPRHATNNPVSSGSQSIACVPSGTYQAWWLKA